MNNQEQTCKQCNTPKTLANFRKYITINSPRYSKVCVSCTTENNRKKKLERDEYAAMLSPI